MPAFTPEFLATCTSGTWTATPAIPVRGFAIDSRALTPGQVFVALRTAVRDGHAFVGAAAAAGAAAAIVARALPDVALPQLVVADPQRALRLIAQAHRRRFTGTVVGVTGSAGKTSTKNLLALLLNGVAGGVLSTQGNLNNLLGVPLTLTRLEPGVHRTAVVEAGISEPAEMGALAAMIEPDHAVVTLVGHAHTQELGGLEGVAREKAALLARVRPGGWAVFPRQCWEFPAFRELGSTALVVVPAGEPVPAAPHVTFAVRHTATQTELRLGGTTFTLRRVTSGQAQNAALALILARLLGRDDVKLQAALGAWEPGALRGEWRDLGGRRAYLDCYNANPASMADSLEYFAAVADDAQPRLFVLGGMEELGASAPVHHRALGRTLQLRADRGDRLIVVGDHANDVRAGALEAGHAPGVIDVVPDAAAAAAIVGGFTGSIFIKGSRRYRLEQVLETAPAPTSTSAPGDAVIAAARC